MEAAEPIDAELEGFAQRRAEYDGSAASMRQSIVDKQAAIDADLIDTEEKRGATAHALDATLVEEYERIRAQPGKVGVAKLVGSTCRGCHLELPAMEVDRLKKLPADQLIHCDECGCILVR
jgi:predicted  nucleic acid-binding Zn-ribbon protein